jgi:hypothetical protein
MTFNVWLIVLLALGPQVTSTTPDRPKFMDGDPRGATGKVFAVDSHKAGPIEVVGVEEVLQQNPPSLWAVTVQNRDLASIDSYRMAAAVVTGDHKIKGTQLLPAIKNLKAGAVSRQQIKIFPTILNPTDRVVFYLSELTANGVQWKADKNDVTALITTMSARYPVQ